MEEPVVIYFHLYAFFAEDISFYNIKSLTCTKIEITYLRLFLETM